MSVQSGAIPITIFEQPGPTLASWTAVERCPACGSSMVEARTLLPDRHYMFGSYEIPMPAAGIALCRCGVCGVHYKSAVPPPSFLAGVFGRHAEVKWAAPPGEFTRELATLRRLWGAPAMDLLDIGAASGALLEAHAASGLAGRRSAFDVMRYAGIEQRLAGEFIEGFIDDPIPEWSREPYDAVTLFDVLEHLYRPQDAFENLRQLTRQGGLVYIETGNTDSFWPRHYGVNEWWYVRLLEHHIFWSRRSLEYMAAAHGFRIVYWKEGRHKSRRNRALPGTIKDVLKTGLYCVTGRQYTSIAHAFGKQGNQPWFPFVRDHFQACLMRA